MKVTCEVIKDLIILKETDSVSDDSINIIDEHIKECNECKKYYLNLKGSNELFDDVKSIAVNIQSLEEKRIIIKSFGKIKRRWIISIIAVIAIIPLILFGIRLTKNQINGYGLNFSNIDDVSKCNSFLNNLKAGNYAKAIEMLDYSQTLSQLRGEYNEALSKNETDKINLNNQTWHIISNKFYSYEFDISNEEEFWKKVISDSVENILIPAEIFNKYADNTTSDEYGFIHISSTWGDYYIYGSGEYVSVFDYEEIDRSFEPKDLETITDDPYMEAYLLSRLTYIIPDDLYKDLRQRYCNSAYLLEEKYGDIGDWTEEAFQQHMVDESTKELEEFFAQGYTIEQIIYTDESISEHIYYWVEIRNPEGNITRYDFTFDVTNGKLVLRDIGASAIVDESSMILLEILD